MYLNTKLEDHKKEIRIAFIGCGKFVSMFLAQYNQLKKIKIDSIVDLNIEQAKENCRKSGLNEEDSLMKSINYLNHKIEEIQSSGSVIGVDKTIIMAALNITHEYLNKNHNADADVHTLGYKNKLTDFNRLLDSILD